MAVACLILQDLNLRVGEVAVESVKSLDRMCKDFLVDEVCLLDCAGPGSP